MWIVFTEEVDDVAPLARPGSWIYSPLPEYELEGAVDSNASGGAHPSVSEIALIYVSGGLLGRTGGFPYPEIDS